MYELFASVIIGGLSAAISTYGILHFAMKRIQSGLVLEQFDNLLEEIAHNEQMQKNIYSIGALVGNGAKAGFGLQKGAGKFKFEDLIVGAIGGYLQKGMGIGDGQSAESQSSPTNITPQRKGFNSA